jgi:hypothetical protein
VSFATPKMRLQRHSLGINKLIGECMSKHKKCSNVKNVILFAWTNIKNAQMHTDM